MPNRFAVCLILLVATTACSSVPKVLPPESKGHPAVRIPDTCEKLPGRLPLPDLNEARNAKVQIVRHRAVIKKLNGRVAAKDTCMKDIRENFAKGGA